MLEGAQDTVQTLLHISTKISENLSAPDGCRISDHDLESLMRRYSDLLRSLDHRFAPRLSAFRVPLSAVHHLDETGLALPSWSQGLVKELKAANVDARHCAEQFLDLADQLRSGGWAGKEPQADRLLMPPPAAAPAKKLKQKEGAAAT